ncbi:unnamed protein product [Porites lobata]|uniref:Uncharacterized protein n=1 Tax=Porites lobata TaxID=104759 RepID=A0ABN8NA11_9CNID|nr:unnamed protein product [Porites lobata]
MHILMMHLFGLVKYWHAKWSSTILTTNMLWRSKTKMETWLDIPKELSRLFHKFLDDFGELEAECIGNRLNAGKGKGVEIPVDYRLVGNDVYLGKLKRKLSKKDVADDINMSKIQRITES